MRTLGVWAIAVGLVVVGLAGPIDREHEARHALTEYERAVAKADREYELLVARRTAAMHQRIAEHKQHDVLLTPDLRMARCRNVQAKRARLLGHDEAAALRSCGEVRP